MLFRLLSILLLLAALPLSSSASGPFDAPPAPGPLGDASASAGFLPVEQAFQIERLSSPQDKVLLRLKVADGYYLYRQRLSFNSRPAGQLKTVQLPAGQRKHDDYFGDVEVYPHNLDVSISLAQTAGKPFDLVVGFQGCAERGLCYPAQTQILPIQGGQAASSSTEPPSAAPQSPSWNWQSLLVFFLAGLGLTFTPCVLPMLPILSALVLRGTPSTKRALALSLAYTLPMAASFALLGALMGVFGASLNLQARLQSPWVLGPFAAFFMLLALGMFGLFDLRLPTLLRRPLESVANTARGGSLGGAAVLGVLASLLVSPCVSAPLAGALLYISASGDAWGGALQLFALGLGMGLPQLALACGGQALLPKSGPWMLAVRNLFGVLLLAVALWMLQRVLPGPLSLALWGTLAAGYGLFLGALEFGRKSPAGTVRQTLGLALLVYGIAAWTGALSGGQDPLQPLHRAPTNAPSAASPSNWTTLQRPEALNSALEHAKSQGQPVLLVWYADWCTSCKSLEKHLLNDPEVLKNLAKFRLIRMDITENTAEQRALLDSYGLFGPPALLLFDQQGQEVRQARIVGETDRQTLLKQLLKTDEKP